MKAKTKKRLIIWLSVIAAIIIIGLVGFRLALNFAGDKAMQMLMENQINSMLDSGEITLDELEAMIEEEPETEPKAEEAAPSETPVTEQKPVEEKPAATAEKPESSQPQKSEAEAKPQAKPAETQKPAEEKPAATRQETVKKASDKLAFGITRADKDEMMKLISKRLSASDMSYLAGLLAGGLTRAERSAAAKIAYSRFSGAELDAVSRFYHKYKKAIMIEPDYGVEE